MLIKKDCSNKNGNIYECDRCKKHCNRTEKVSIGIDRCSSGWKKKWDLCLHCYKSLCKGIVSFYDK